MTPEEITAFLDRTSPPLVGVVATLRPDGSPHAVPVWYSWDGHLVRIWTGENRAWVRNVRADPRVAFTVQESQPPYAAVTLRGRADISAADIGADIDGIVRRYLLESERSGYVATWSQLRTIVRIHPDTIRGWGRGY